MLMHRITRSDGTTTQSEVLRWAFSCAYFLFALAGVFLLLSPEGGNVYGRSGDVMEWFLVVGGAASLFGCASRHWVGEFVGGPLLVVGIASLGLDGWVSSHEAYPWIAGANLALLLGIASVGIARWRVVLSVYRLMSRLAVLEKRRIEL